MKDLRTDRLGLLLDQLDRARQLAHARLEGLASPASLPEGTPLSPGGEAGRSATRSTCGSRYPAPG
jgi:hypothetical protein